MTTQTVQHIVSVSGGKDSTALYLLALKRLGPNGFRAIFCDTGHESEVTYNYVRKIPALTGGPEIEWIRADFTKAIATRKANLQNFWGRTGVPQARIDEVSELLRPTGNPFLDLCILKGRFPSTRARFCTQELKVFPMMNQIIIPARSNGPVCSWRGVRRDESKARQNAKKISRGDFGVWVFQPLINYTADDVFQVHDDFGIEPNPLYKMGFSRVGCFPCIMCKKSEMAEISRRFPEEISRVATWEKLVVSVSKHGLATFFANDKTPGAHVNGVLIEEVAEWSRTGRGGWQFEFLLDEAEASECSSVYGLCE